MTLTELAERTRHAIYSRLAASGALPERECLARQLGVPLEAYDGALAELARTRNIVLKAGAVEMAHPFATRSFGFSVMGPRTLWWGGCAWDAFAIPNLVAHSPAVLVATTCPACSTPHAWTVTNQAPPAGGQVAHFLTPVDRIWPDAAHACENQRIYCSEECVERWLARTRRSRGYVMSLATLWRLSAHWYDGRLDTPYARREPTAAAEYFRGVGLRGSFWGLPEHERRGEPTAS